MIEMGQQNFVSGFQLSTDRPPYGESQRGHVRTKNNFIRIAAKKIRHRGPCACDNLVCLPAGGVGAAGVGVTRTEVVRNCVDHTLRNLSSAWSVKKGRRFAIHVAR